MFEKLASILGGNVFSGVAELVGKFVEDPTKRAELQQELIKLQTSTMVQLQQIDAADRDSARKREMAVGGNTPAVLAFIVVGGFLGLSFAQFAALYIWPETNFPPQAWVLIGNISGYMASKSELALAYYFGTSAGSQAKTELLAKADAIK